MDDVEKIIARLQRRCGRERNARIAAEEILEQKSRELFDVNQRLAGLNEQLERQVAERTGALEAERAHALAIAEIDQLTGLKNRHSYKNALGQAVGQAASAGKFFALLFIDLDNFKALNDTYGHGGGDIVLQQVASRLKSLTRARDHVARLGGDEFAILAEIDAETDSPINLADRIVDVFNEPIPIDHRSADCGVSVGFALCPRHSSDAGELQRFADLALYSAKSKGRGNAVQFDVSIGSAHRFRLALAADLASALETAALEIHYQPIVNLLDERPVGMEALLRWRHPDRGWIDPLTVLKTAEECGLFDQVSRKCIELAITQAAPLLITNPSFWLSINLAEQNLRDEQLAAHINDICGRLNVVPSQIRFEITEQALIRDIHAAHEIMSELGNRGFRFAIDDFGIGYSNMLTLSRLPFHTIKIDRSFTQEAVDNHETRTIASAMINLGHALGLDVIVEGVETAQQAHMMRELGGHMAQGYHFGRPSKLEPS
ncbi:EAL domain-containing protein [Roseibium album]|uniref:putative bifunctional diguanylate cyclase/phosphodiesterase n=1 Tax=Roseibium album TaxID=311410 RepID=UPI000CF08AA1|nr:diguanylate cyclase (GGDEF)-like protein [Labrenzia sp. EL_142]